MFAGSSRKPYTAVTVQVERLTGPEYEENDLSGIVDLIEVIRIQDTGPTEAARALRKKLKYGTPQRQLRALTILDGLIQNGGTRFQRTFADEQLLERLRMLPRDEMVDQEVREKCNVLFRQWSTYKGTSGMGGIASLSKQLPTRKRPTASQSKVVQETEREALENPFEEPSEREPEPEPVKQPTTYQPPATSLPSSSRRRSLLGSSSSPGSVQNNYSYYSSSKKDKKEKRKPFSLEKERGNIMQAIAAANVASTNLLNSLKFVNRENTRVSEDAETVQKFEMCKRLRRQILRYIQLVERDELIGSLLSANDELVKALMAFEIMDKSIEDDSDSDAEYGGGPAMVSHSRQASKVNEDLAGLTIGEAPPAKPPRPGNAAKQLARQSVPHDESESEPEDPDENDPFGDQHAVR